MRMIGDSNIIEKEVSLYFHIPFCTRKCGYCHFYVLPDQEISKNQLAEGFQIELDLLQRFLVNKKIVTIYFGGGTPFLFGPERIQSLLNLIRRSCSLSSTAEITLEANPENVTLELMQAYAEAGINRVSIGIQTLDSHLLQLLGRLHSPQIATEAIHATFQAGIHNISIDLMYDLPEQTLKHWTSTLDIVRTLPISHLSLYNLTIEPHTQFFKNQSLLQPKLPTEEESLAMYEIAIDYLEEMGLKHYEISAFAKTGQESQHNKGYWMSRPFMGLGPSAFSYWEGSRFRNIAHLGRYCRLLKENKFPRDFEEKLEQEAHRRELFVIQLRLREGVNLAKFALQHGALDADTDKLIHRYVNEGCLCVDQVQDQVQVRLTRKGMLFYDTLAVDLI